MAYVALKPCCFAGHRFKIGESVPDELIHPGAAKNLEKMGIIAEQGENAAKSSEKHDDKETTLCIVVHEKSGDMTLKLTKEGAQAIFDVLISKATDAEPIIEQMTDGDALILLHLTDSRKTIKEAAENRAKELSQDGEE